MKYSSVRNIIARYEEIKKNQIITVYHATSFNFAKEMINGFDALEIRKRHFQTRGYRHKGLFVSPTPLNQFGNVLFEIETRAKFLHGTDYSGYIGRSLQKEDKEILRKTYPQSFRPFLSQTLDRKVEPQALLLGLVKPRQIKRIRYQGSWHTRKEFVEKYIQGREKRVADLNLDLTYLKYSLQEVIQILALITKKEPSDIERRFQRSEMWEFDRQYNYIGQTLKALGFKGTATDKYTRMIISSL
jgi:hypothetical protein